MPAARRLGAVTALLALAAAWPASALAAPAPGPDARWYRVELQVRHVYRSDMRYEIPSPFGAIVPGTPRIVVQHDVSYSLRGTRPVLLTRRCVPLAGLRPTLPGGACPPGSLAGYLQALRVRARLQGRGPRERTLLRTTALLDWTCTPDESGANQVCTHSPCGTRIEKERYTLRPRLRGTLALDGPPGESRLSWEVAYEPRGTPPRSTGVASLTGSGNFCTQTVTDSAGETTRTDVRIDPYEETVPGALLLPVGPLRDPGPLVVESSTRTPGVSEASRASYEGFEAARVVPEATLGARIVVATEQVALEEGDDGAGATFETRDGTRVTVRLRPCPRGGLTRRGC